MRTERWRDRRRGEGGNVQNDEVSGNDEERQWDALGAGGIWVFFEGKCTGKQRDKEMVIYMCVCMWTKKAQRQEADTKMDEVRTQWREERREDSGVREWRGGVGGVDIAEPDIFFSILFFLPLFLPSFYTYGTYG